LKELARLPDTVRERVERLAFGDDIKRDPYLAGRAQKLTGYDTYYKIRVGDYRVGVRIDLGAQTVEFQRVLHRREIYRKFP
jgi:mRNA interferase RelE/StbE